MNNNAFFFGVTRFSVFSPGSSAWKITAAQESEYLDHLYSDERLSPRFDIFVNYALPVYEEYSKKYDYKHIVLYSDKMPDKWKKILFDCGEKYNFLCLHKVSKSIEFMEVMEEQLARERAVDCPVALFRVDDDDLLSKDFIDQLSNYTDFPFVGMSVSFGCGVAAKYTSGSFDDFRSIKKPMIAIGLANIGRYDSSSLRLWLPKAVSHVETDIHRPVIVDCRKPSFVWTHHFLQDSNHQESSSSGKAEIDKKFLSYRSVKDISCIDSFPTILKDYLRFSNGKIEVANFVTFEHRYEHEFEFGGLGISQGGSYRIFYDISLYESTLSNSKAVVLCFKEAMNIDDIVGMQLSPNKDVGWYRYIAVTSGAARGHVDFYLPDKCKIDSVFVKNWASDSVLCVNELIVEKIA
ncbi:glycosyltransferase [Vreelandella sp. 21]|uniref:glycosyltransferase n=1 Tax=Vreelandella sp. 21 TaxID=3402864 RepID=UPI003D9AA2DE